MIKKGQLNMKNKLQFKILCVIFMISFLITNTLPGFVMTAEAATVTLNKEIVTIAVGRTEQLKLNGVSGKTKWSSSNKKIATVNSKGKITAKNAGTAKITAKNGSKKYVCKVTVKKIALNKEELSLIVGKTTKLKLYNAKGKITWSSSNKKIATVNSKGKITAKKAGTAKITAKNGSKKYVCKITVQKKTATSISLNNTNVTLYKGDTCTLKATVKPSDIDDKTVTWSSSDSTVATVDSNGMVRAISIGESVITATCSGKSIACKISVIGKPVKAITLNKTNITLCKGKTEQLTATVSPTDAEDQTITWSSSDSTIATVDSNGLITAVSAGNAKIYAKNGNVTSTCLIEVVQNEASNDYFTVEEIYMSNEGANVTVGDTIDFYVRATSKYDISTIIIWFKSVDNSNNMMSLVQVPEKTSEDNLYKVSLQITDSMHESMYPGKWVAERYCILDKYKDRLEHSFYDTEHLYFYIN